MASYPAPDTGLDCDPNGADDDCGFPRDGTIELRFDRYLRPDTAVRQSIWVSLASRPEAGLFLEPEYDVVERAIRYRTGGVLEPGLLYKLELFDPEQDEFGFGFRAIDGAALEARGSLPLSFNFRTARAAPTQVPEAAPSPSCSEVQQALTKGGCTSAACHGPGRPLDLSSAAAIERTFLRPARETELGDRPGSAFITPARFGVGLPLITPGEAAWSYLLYKLLGNPRNFAGRECETRFEVPFAGECLFGAEEATRLGHWFVLGMPMPPPGYEAPAFGLDELRLIQRWIAEGAALEDCL